MAYYESGTTKMTRPTYSTFYDEWGMPLSSEGQYTAGPGHAAKLAAERDWKIAQEKERGYYQNPNQMVLSPGDAASAGDAQARRQGDQQDNMYSQLMAMLSGGSSSSSSGGGGWTPGSSLVGGSMPPQGSFSGAMAGGGGDKPMRPQMPIMGDQTGGGSWSQGGGTTPAGAGPKPYAPAGGAQQMNHGMRGSTDQILQVQQLQNAKLLQQDPNTWQGRDVKNANAMGRYGIGPNGALVEPGQKVNPLTGKMEGVGGAQLPTGGGAGGAASGGASGGQGGQPFGQAFEQSLYSAFNKPGIDPEPIINKGTEEIAAGESNALVQLGNRAANQGIEGGAVQAGNREVLSDFAGKRANLARDVRVEAAKNAEDQRMSALNTAGGYLGRISDNQRQDRNQMMSLMMSQMQNQQNRATDYSGLASQAGQRSAFAPILAPGGGKPGSGASGGSTFAGGASAGFGQAAPQGAGSFSALFGPSNQSSGSASPGVYNPKGGLQAQTHNAANNRAAMRKA